MVQKITDVGPFLEGLLSTFKQSVTAAKDKYLQDMAAADNYYKSKLPSVVPAASQYLVDHPVVAVAYSKEFLALLSGTKDAAVASAGNVLSEAQIGYDTMRTNANLDYSNAVSRAYDEFNFALSSAYIVDATFDSKYRAIAGDTVTVEDKKLVSIKASNGMYLGVGCAHNPSGSKAVIANSLAVVECEQFGFDDLGDNKCSLLARNGKYLSVAGGAGSAVVASADYVGDHETFTYVDMGDGTTAFVVFDGINYMRAENGGGGAVITGAGAANPGDRFVVTPLAFKSLMTEFMDSVVAEIDAATQASYDNYSMAYKDSRTSLNDVVKTFILDRPVVRFTGVGQKPVAGILLDSDNSFTFEIENVGKLAWSGNVALKVKDQYNKSIISNPVSVSTLAPGSKRSIEITVYIPKKDPITGYNFGSNMSTFIMFE